MSAVLEATLVRLSFDWADVSRWAGFSHDFNPIHFDSAFAREAGLDDLVVHGMLALLPVKVAVTEAAAGLDAMREGWMRFRTVFRSPVPQSTIHEAVLQRPNDSRLDFRVHAVDTGKERFRGSYGACADSHHQATTEPSERRPFSNLSSLDAGRFRVAYPSVTPGWIAVDAIVFSDFLRIRLSALALAAEQEGAHARLSASSVVFMQTSQTVTADTHALGGPGPLPFDCAELSYAMAPPAMVAGPSGVMGSAALTVVHGRKQVMLIEIGLLAKMSNRKPKESP